MPRPQFTLRALLVAILVVAAFFGGRLFGIQGERIPLMNEVVEALDEAGRLQGEAKKRMDSLAYREEQWQLFEKAKTSCKARKSGH